MIEACPTPCARPASVASVGFVRGVRGWGRRRAVGRLAPRSMEDVSNEKQRPVDQDDTVTGVPVRTDGSEPVPGRERAPLSVVIVSLCVILESVAVLAAAVFAARAIGQNSPVSVTGRVVLMVLLVLVAVWQGIVAAKHIAGKAWTRSAVVVWQLFQVIVSIYYISNAPAVKDWAGLGLGIGMLVVGGVALVTVFAPSTRAWLEPDDAPR